MSNDLAVKKSQLTNSIKQMSDYLIEKIESKIDVKDDVFSTYNAVYYGLKAGEEGKATNTDAMNALITKLNQQGGGTIFIPKGEYYFNKHITWQANVSLRGEGIDITVLKSFGGTEENHVIGYPVIDSYRADTVGNTPKINNCRFTDFTIDGSELHTDATVEAKGIFIVRMENCVWRDIKIKGTGSTGFGCDFLGNSVIDHVICEDCGRSQYFVGCAGIGVGTKGIETENLVITNCVAKGCYNYGIFVETQELFKGKEELKDFEKRGVIISNCISHDCVKAGFAIKGGQDISLNNCISYNNKYGIELGIDLKNIQINDCLIQENIGHGIYVKDYYKGQDGSPNLNSAREIDGLGIYDCTLFKNGGDGINIFEKDGTTQASDYTTMNVKIEGCDINKNTGRGITFNNRNKNAGTEIPYTNVFVKNNNIVANGLEGFWSGVKLVSGTFQGNYINKNNTTNTASTSNVTIDCDLNNFDFIFNRICDGKSAKTCNYNIEIKAGHEFIDSIVKNNILAGYKTGAILTNNVTKTGYAEVQQD